jgi:phosphatidate cytidylyltransferase
MRDMGKSILTGLVLGGIVIASVFWHPLAICTVLGIACLIAIWELAVAFKKADIICPVLIVSIASVMMMYSTYWGLDRMMITYIVGCVCIILYASFERTVHERHCSYTSGIFVLSYLPLMLSFLVAIACDEHDGPLKLLLIFIAVVSSDTFGLLVGMKFGKTKMAPVISPKKTVEGLIGSFVFTLIITYIYTYFVFGNIYFAGLWWWPLVFTILAVSIGTFGDLTESVIKRDVNIKDIGGILPGHGGMLDRMDSILLLGPIMYYFILYTL